MFEIAGLTVSAIGLLVNLHSKFKDLASWKEKDLEVDMAWLDIALKRNVLSGKNEDFAWMRLRSLPTAELSGTHSAVIAVNESKRLKYRLVVGPADDRLILTQKLQLPRP